MANDCVDGNYLGAYSRFFTEFIANMKPNDQLPVKISTYNVTESELVGEIVNIALQYLNKSYCPSSLQSYIVHLVIQAIKSLFKEQPEICKSEKQLNTYAPLELMRAIIHEVNEICRRYLDNSRLALLPPPPSTPLPYVNVNAIKNTRRTMEDRHAMIFDMHTIFDIKDDSIANYYAVFDGHAGQDASTYSATHLHQYLIESVHYPKNPEEALRDAFLTTDKQFSAKDLKGGTTAVCALLLNKKLYIAWVGDSMAALVKRDGVTQLVNPHRPTREDELDRIHKNGGIVANHFGTWRVNGMLNISRAIGDVQCKPCISSEPEVRCVSLDETEHFLIIACDGLWDYVDERTSALQVYEEIFKNPHDCHAASVLVQSAKLAGSKDNITVIVVFLTPPIEIASKSLNVHSVLPHGILNNMDSNNPFLSNLNGQFDVNASFLKQQQQQQLDADLQAGNDAGLGLDDNRMMYETSSNGKYVAGNGDGNDEYDYSDLGPETDVDAVDDVPDLRTSHDRLSRELFPDEKRRLTKEDDDKKNNLNHDDDLDDLTILRHEDVYGADKVLRDNNICIDNNARVETDIPVDNDEAPTSPRATKPLQHALIPELDNVADSEDSEDEWNYYRVDPNKEDPSKTIVNESQSIEDRNIRENPELGVKDNTEIQSSEGKNDIKCERSKEDTSFELINSNISAESKVKESEQNYICLDQEEKYQQEEDMEFHLNPNAAEFVPVSPPMVRNNNNKRNFSEDYPISGSPLKQTLVMDDIPVPTESEFEKEVSQRPRDIDAEDFTNGEYVGNAAYNVNNDNTVSLDESENSSTKAEIGDDSIARIAATTQRRSSIPQWDERMPNDSLPDAQEYDIATDPMAMSLTPGDFQVAFEKGVDLNALHDLTGGDMDDDNDTCAKENALPLNSSELRIKDERPHTPISDDKSIDFASSTPYAYEKSSCAVTSERDESNTNGHLAVEVGKQLSFIEAIENHSSMEYETNKQEVIRLSDNDELQIRNESGLINIPQLETLKLVDSPTLIASDSLECGSILPAESETFTDSTLEKLLPSNLHACPTNFVEDSISTELFVTKEETLPKQKVQKDLLELISTETETTLSEKLEPEIFQNLSTQKADNQFPSSNIESERIVDFSPTGLEEATGNVGLIQNFAQNEKMCNFETNKIGLMESDIKLDSTLDSSNSTQEFMIVEERLQRENQAFLKNFSVSNILSNILATDTVLSVGIMPSDDKQIPEKALASNDVVLNKEETVPQKITTTTSNLTKTKVAAKRPMKATTKSSPTSPSKSASTNTRPNATTTQPIAVKKPISNTASRSKNLDGSAKTTTVSSTSGKSAVTRTASVPKTTSVTSTTRTITPRTGIDVTKPKATTVMPKSGIGASDKKPSTTNGCVKSTNRFQSNFRSTSKATISSTTTKSTSAKLPTTAKTSTSTATSKPRPMSAAAAIKASVTTSKSTTGSISTSRPKTAPISSSINRSPRDTAKTTATKSPMIDKQIKETANKQISLARAGASTMSKTSRNSAPATITNTGTTKLRVSTTAKSLNVSGTLPSKKVTSKVSTGMKTTATNKTKVLENGVTKNTETTNAIITTTNNKIQDDIPRKDTSPVVVPTDNQLLLTAD